jgi:two-component system chemotaxis response regulator CheY
MNPAARILVVEDSTAIRQFVAMALTDVGHSVIEAIDGLEALEFARGDTTINLVLTDLNMPRMGGLALTRELRRLPHMLDVPVLFLSSESSSTVQRLGQEAGATDWMLKPFRSRQLLERIEQLLAAG